MNADNQNQSRLATRRNYVHSFFFFETVFFKMWRIGQLPQVSFLYFLALDIWQNKNSRWKHGQNKRRERVKASQFAYVFPTIKLFSNYIIAYSYCTFALNLTPRSRRLWSGHARPIRINKFNAIRRTGVRLDVPLFRRFFFEKPSCFVETRRFRCNQTWPLVFSTMFGSIRVVSTADFIFGYALVVSPVANGNRHITKRVTDGCQRDPGDRRVPGLRERYLPRPIV